MILGAKKCFGLQEVLFKIKRFYRAQVCSTKSRIFRISGENFFLIHKEQKEINFQVKKANNIMMKNLIERFIEIRKNFVRAMEDRCTLDIITNKLKLINEELKENANSQEKTVIQANTPRQNPKEATTVPKKRTSALYEEIDNEVEYIPKRGKLKKNGSLPYLIGNSPKFDELKLLKDKFKIVDELRRSKDLSQLSYNSTIRSPKNCSLILPWSFISQNFQKTGAMPQIEKKVSKESTTLSPRSTYQTDKFNDKSHRAILHLSFQFRQTNATSIGKPLTNRSTSNQPNFTLTRSGTETETSGQFLSLKGMPSFRGTKFNPRRVVID